MIKKSPKLSETPVAYRIFVIPGFGRIRAPADMTEDALLAELEKDTSDETGR